MCTRIHRALIIAPTATEQRAIQYALLHPPPATAVLVGSGQLPVEYDNVGLVWVLQGSLNFQYD